MTDPNAEAGELISALADGEIRADELPHALDAASRSPEGLAAWSSYHLVGQALRGQLEPATAGDGEFLTRLRARLAEEAPGAAPRQAPVVDIRAVAPQARPDSANDAVVRWKLLAGAASLAAVAVIGWHVASLQAPVSTLAAGQPVAPTAPAALAAAAPAAAPPVMLRDPRLDALMAAHKQFGGTSALQKPAGFLRNATFDAAER